MFFLRSPTTHHPLPSFGNSLLSVEGDCNRTFVVRQLVTPASVDTIICFCNNVRTATNRTGHAGVQQHQTAAKPETPTRRRRGSLLLPDAVSRIRCAFQRCRRRSNGRGMAWYSRRSPRQHVILLPQSQVSCSSAIMALRYSQKPIFNMGSVRHIGFVLT